MSDTSIVIKGGTIVDETGERSGDVVVDDGHIVAVGPDLSAARTLDAGGCIVSPGFVDLNTHLREPGDEDAETVESGARAAAVGGYTCVIAMPDTAQPVDNAAVAREILLLGAKAICDVRTAGTITIGRAGETLAPIAELAALGVRLFTDDGHGVQDSRLMRRAMEYASVLDVVLAQHCSDDALAAGGHMHEGEWSSKLGIPGAPAEAEELVVMRDIALSRLTGARVHFQTLSTEGAVAMVAAAKAGSLPITAEATPHHFTLTHDEIRRFDPNHKVDPPLRTEADVAAVRAGLLDGTLDAIATDHAPHPPDAKAEPFDDAPAGAIGLETALGLAVSELGATVSQLVAVLSTRPARIAGVADRHGGPVTEGRPANLAVWDPTAQWTVDPGAFHSRSRNTAFAGRTLTGRVRHTLLDGEIVVLDGDPQR